MKNIRRILLLVSLISYHVLGQNKLTENQWSIDGNIGLNGASGPFASGYASNYLAAGHADLGIRYMFSPYVGVKWDFGADRIKNDESGPLINYGDFPGAASKEFESHYFRTSLQMYFNVGRVFQLSELNDRIGLLLHGGIGFSSMKRQAYSIWFQSWKNQGTDEMMNFMIGLTPQFKINDKFAIHLDFTMVGNAWQSMTWDFTQKQFEKGLHGRLFNLSVGGSYYLGESIKHEDLGQNKLGKNKWSVDGNLGFNGASGPFASGYASNYLSVGHADLGLRYMFSPYIGAKWDIGADRIKNDESGPLINYGDFPGAASKEFESHYFRTSLQLYFNVGRVFHLDELNDRIGLLFHGGAGFSSMKRQAYSIWFQSWKNQGTDEMMNFMIGATPQYKINDKLALHFDVTMIGNAWQSMTWDFTEKHFEKGLNGRLLNLSIGCSYYIGKSATHMDWGKSSGGASSIVENYGSFSNSLITANDTDGDGVINDKDKCPNEYGSLTNEGCPEVVALIMNDRDGDGIRDDIDNCPDVAGLIAQNGCPADDLNSNDKDMDGIRDDIDHCPDVAGPIEYLGCPEELAEEQPIELQDYTVYFRTNSYSVKEDDRILLDELASKLENSDLKIEILGYSDPIGNISYNIELSKKRSNKVRNYLIEKGVKEEQILNKGLGIYDEEASSKQELSQSRRVEIIQIH